LSNNHQRFSKNITLKTEGMIFDQSEYNVRCEWGDKGVALLAPISDVIIIVDVFSFSTAVEIATRQGAIVFPYWWKDDTAYDFAKSVEAEVADKNNVNNYSLSPSSLTDLPSKARLVLPSPNGAALSLSTAPVPTIAGCLRNARAVAFAASSKGQNIAVIPAGERWDDGTLRPCLEDLLGAGALISYLRGTFSPEAIAAKSAFESASEGIFNWLKDCSSGKEKLSRNEENDVGLAAQLNVSECVPILCNEVHGFINATIG
jgi:2-phosphosulfolactate phosphatase